MRGTLAMKWKHKNLWCQLWPLMNFYMSHDETLGVHCVCQSILSYYVLGCSWDKLCD